MNETFHSILDAVFREMEQDTPQPGPAPTSARSIAAARRPRPSPASRWGLICGVACVLGLVFVLLRQGDGTPTHVASPDGIETSRSSLSPSGVLPVPEPTTAPVAAPPMIPETTAAAVPSSSLVSATDGDVLNAFRQEHSLDPLFGSVWVDRLASGAIPNVRVLDGFPEDQLDALRAQLHGDLQVHVGGPSWNDMQDLMHTLATLPDGSYLLDTSAGLVHFYGATAASLPEELAALPYAVLHPDQPMSDAQQPL